jgi:uncharacterized membrane-anchored protein YhcB (DUF1043 family)
LVRSVWVFILLTKVVGVFVRFFVRRFQPSFAKTLEELEEKWYEMMKSIDDSFDIHSFIRKIFILNF